MIPILVVQGRQGKYLRTAPDSDALNNLSELPDCLPNPGQGPAEYVPRIRRNIAKVSLGERVRLRDAILGLNTRFYPLDTVSWWKKQDEIHQSTHIHNGPAFLPWHRELVNRFEALLREVDPTVTLHYWDWRTDPRASPNGRGGNVDLFTPHFMGSPQGAVGAPFTTLPMPITRAIAAGAPQTIEADEALITEDAYELMRLDLERAHDWAHAYIGGTLGQGHSAFQDPFVFLLHANVDRLWASWQLRARGDHRLALSRLDPAAVYGGERDIDPFEVKDANGGSTFVDGIPHLLQPWAGGGTPPVAPWGPPLQTRPAEPKTSTDPTVVRPPLYDSYVFPLGCSWEAMILGARLPDGDVIQTKTTLNAVDPTLIEFVLESGPGVTWWKGLRIPDGPNETRMLHTQDSRRSDRTFIYASQVTREQQLVFHKAKFLGSHRIVYRLGDLERLLPGSRVTFRWLGD